jgi:hypothetical protein
MFPLLAVLICAMGALVLLLLSVTHQARQQAAKQAAAKNAEKRSSIAAEMEMVEWRVEQLKNSRKATEDQLADARAVLGHVEDHYRRLRGQFLDLSQQAQKAAAEGLKAGRFAAAGEEDLRQVEGQIAEAQQRLEQAQRTAGNRPKSYAIVPYDGRNRTRRRPIYIECRGDAVVLQPENVVFTEADFDEPLGPGNPLAAAIRAACEQMRLQGSLDPQDSGAPYPLLLVRPTGISFYECALVAMKSWGPEFGYELINEDWQLKYPPPDPNLAKSVNQAVVLARQEHARLIAAAPSRYGKRPRNGAYRTSAGGEADGQGGAAEGESPGVYASKPSERYAHDAGGGSTATGRGGRSGLGGGGFGGSGESGESGESGGSGRGGGIGLGSGEGHSGDAEFAANNPYMSLPGPGMVGPPGIGPGGMGAGTGTGNGMGGAAGSGFGLGMVGPPSIGPGGMGAGTGAANGMGGAAGSGVGLGMLGPPSIGPGGMVAGTNGTVAVPFVAGTGTGNGMGGVPPGNPTAYQSNGQSAGSPPGAPGVVRPDGYINGRPNDGDPAPGPARPNPPSAVAMVPAMPLRPGEWRPSEETDPPKRDRDAEEKEKQEKKKHPYDKVRLDHNQDDWALRNATRHAAAISRPIHVDCYPDRIVLVPDANSGEPRLVLCESGGQRDADKLVAAVWEIMDAWGMAGREMYWRPILNFYVVPGAETRMSDLARSLEGSGLVIERKQ